MFGDAFSVGESGRKWARLRRGKAVSFINLRSAILVLRDFFLSNAPLKNGRTRLFAPRFLRGIIFYIAAFFAVYKMSASTSIRSRILSIISFIDASGYATAKYCIVFYGAKKRQSLLLGATPPFFLTHKAIKAK